jgi:hypothetical protein
MAAPTTPATEKECAACRVPAVEWVLVLPDTDRPYRALCASCAETARRPGISAVEDRNRTWSFL